MSIEAVVLTGGASRRMGRDKATLPVEGVPQAERIVHALVARGIQVTVLGRTPIEGAAFLPDREEFAGPLAALAGFQPTAGLVFVASCDLPRFDARLIDLLAVRIGDADAAVPFLDGWRQPLCAIYRAEAWHWLSRIREEQCAMSWLDKLRVQEVTKEDFDHDKVDPAAATGANTPEELRRAIDGPSKGMRDITDKDLTVRVATAEATLRMNAETAEAVRTGETPKGDPLPVARVAGVMAAKNTPQLIPYCHPIPLESVKLEFEVGEDSIRVHAEVKTTAKTGVEMEALAAATAAALTLYDMLKAIDMGMTLQGIRVLEKRGGKSVYRAER